MIGCDQMGPVAAKSYAGRELVKPEPKAQPSKPAERARQEIDYGRHSKGYIFGAFRPATGGAFTCEYERRTTVNWIDFLEQVEEWIPAEVERVYAILDNLKMHRAADTLLFSLQHPRWEFCLSAPLCGLLESDRAVVESAAVAGAQRATVRELGGSSRSDQSSN